MQNMLSRRSLLTSAFATTCAPRALAQTAAAPNHLTMQAAYINDAEFLGYYIAIEKGFYKAQNIDLTYLPGGPDIIPESALLSGTADLALTELDTTIQVITKQQAPFKIIGTQYQKNPLGIISLAKSLIKTPADLIGKTLSVSAVSMVLIHAFFKINNIPNGAVRIVPDSQADPTALLTGSVDAACGFVTDFPYAVRLAGQEPYAFLLADHGLSIFNDTIVVSQSTLATKRQALIRWLRASRQGWVENFKDPSLYTKLFHETWLKPAARPIDYDIFSNTSYQPLMQTPTGFFALTEPDISRNIALLNKLGLHAHRDMFDTTLLAEI